MKWQRDPELQSLTDTIVKQLGFSHVQPDRLFCYRSYESKARAYARIWSFPKIFQEALDVEPAYVIEFLSEKFDKLSYEDQKKVVIHELLHIPKNFSGALLPHSHGNKRIDREVERLYKMMKTEKG